MSPARPALVVVAAGSGLRLGASVHKALVEVAGAPLVLHTLRRLLTWERAEPVILVVHPDDRRAMTSLVAQLPRPILIVDGGARRQDSVAAGVAALPESTEVVLVHDAARPFVPVQTLDALVDAAAADGCALLAVPVADTVKQARDDDPDRVERTVPRAQLWAAQTPQAFRRRELLALLADAGRRGHEVTDEAALFEGAGRRVRFVEGSRLNFKVTTPDDLRLAAAWIAHDRQDAATRPPSPKEEDGCP